MVCPLSLCLALPTQSDAPSLVLLLWRPTASGRLWSWGLGRYGELGRSLQSPYHPTPMPIQLPAGVVVTQISVGDHHALAVTAAGALYAWGRDDRGQLGVRRDAGGVAGTGGHVRVRANEARFDQTSH